MAKRVSQCKFCLADLEPWQFCYCNDECRRLYYLAPAKRARRVSRTTGKTAKYNGTITEYHEAVMKSYHTDIFGAIKIIEGSKRLY